MDREPTVFDGRTGILPGTLACNGRHPAGVRGADRWFWEAAHGPGAARRRSQPGSHLDQQR